MRSLGLGLLKLTEQVVQFFPYFSGRGPQNSPAGDQDDPKSPDRGQISGIASGLCRRPLGNAHDMTDIPVTKPLSESFPQEPLGSVSFHRVAYFFAGNHGPGHVIGGQQVNHEEAPYLFGASLVDLVKFVLIRQRSPCSHYQSQHFNCKHGIIRVSKD